MTAPNTRIPGTTSLTKDIETPPPPARTTLVSRQEAGCPADVAFLRVVVVGQGYVRLPLALRAAQMAIAWWG
ncbi:hypothetical protein HEP81_07822 [Streptomyces griseofuscus]|uniref:Uncharacterized protein n=1 Tax=Streptomyces griseofuscus TaxID=146922 RepID=A0A7H1QCM2_9ACTN|nr:hypothetical protein HEP81_07822 [Streptomyces griseofuscus]